MLTPRVTAGPFLVPCSSTNIRLHVRCVRHAPRCAVLSCCTGYYSDAKDVKAGTKSWRQAQDDHIQALLDVAGVRAAKAVSNTPRTQHAVCMQICANAILAPGAWAARVAAQWC